MIIRSNIVLIVVSSLLGIYWLARWYENTNLEEHTLVQNISADTVIKESGIIETEKSIAPTVKISSAPSREIVKRVSAKLAKAIPEQESTTSPASIPHATTIRKSRTVVVTLSSDPGIEKGNTEKKNYEEEVVIDNIDKTQIKTETNTDKTVATNNVGSKTTENTPTIAQKIKPQDKNTENLVKKSSVGFVAPTLQSPDPAVTLSSLETDTAQSQLATAANSNRSGKPVVAASQKPFTAQQLLQKTAQSEPANPIENSEIELSRQTASYRINKGDTLYALARRFNTTIDTLKKINGLRDDTIHVGERIWYPNSN